jgi:hypothetical protein
MGTFAPAWVNCYTCVTATELPQELKWAHAGHLHQEAHMQKIISIALVLVGIVFVSVMTLNVTHTETNATKSKIHSGMATYGLHVALPNNIKTFPVEVVPLP